jgi:flagellar basal-body rod protein FlgB
MSDAFTAIHSLHGALDYHLDRHNVLLSNVAHVDTPGYRPVDLERVDAGNFDAVLGVALARTQGAHLGSPNGAPAALHGRVFEDSVSAGGNDGNHVSLDREAAKIAANHVRYDVISAVASAELRQLAYAAGDGKG